MANGNKAKVRAKKLIEISSNLLIPLNYIARLVSKKRNKDKLVPIFIVGAARSGTTLLYQAMGTNRHLGYINGWMAAFPKLAILMAILTKYMYRNRKVTFKSSYGKSPGLDLPQQGNEIWAQWFKYDTSKEKLVKKDEESFRAVVECIQSAIHLPLVIKWPGFSAHIRELRHAFPEACFVVVERGWYENAKSLYKGRLDLTGNPMKSITRLPPSYNYSGDDPGQSIAEYLKSVDTELEWLKENSSENQTTCIAYEDFCKNPKSQLDRIINNYSVFTGLTIANAFSVPKEFKVSNGPALDEQVDSDLLSSLELAVDSLRKG
ncbi:MAG: sulfotransferase [Pseudomonadota bacterium]